MTIRKKYYICGINFIEMEREKIVVVAEGVKAFAIGFIGICFFALGTTYFEEQASYRVPRILYPVFDLFGNIGLAIGLIILGGALIFYGYAKWKKFNENKKIYIIAALPVLILALVLAFTVDLFKDRDEGMTNEQRREKQMDEIKNMAKPDFKNAEIEKHFVEFDVIFAEFQEKIQAKDAQGMHDCEQKYMDWSSDYTMMEKLSTDEKVQVAAYNAQLAMKWNDARHSLDE
jgi:hypothetical protein